MKPETVAKKVKTLTFNQLRRYSQVYFDKILELDRVRDREHFDAQMPYIRAKSAVDIELRDRPWPRTSNWEKDFDKRFVFETDNGPGTVSFLFRMNKDGTMSIALPEDVKEFIRETLNEQSPPKKN